MKNQLLVTAEVSRLLGVSIDRLIRAHRNGVLPEPARAGHHRIYTPEDVERVKAFFGTEPKEVSQDAGDRGTVST